MKSGPSAYAHWACVHPKVHRQIGPGPRIGESPILLNPLVAVWCDTPGCPEYRRLFVAAYGATP